MKDEFTNGGQVRRPALRAAPNPQASEHKWHDDHWSIREELCDGKQCLL
jgi:hypothetical protein